MPNASPTWDACQSEPEPSDLARDGLQVLRDRLTGDTVIDLRNQKPASAKEMGRADGVIRALANGSPQAVIKADRFRGWFNSDAQQQMVLDRLIDAKLLNRNEARGLNTRQVRMPKLTEKPSCYV